MKIPKLFKKAAAFVMAAVTALSIMPATAFAAGDIGTIFFSHTYDSNGNAMRYNSSANIGGYTAGGTGNYKYRMFVDGENAFCIQPGVPLKTGNTLKKASSDTWNALSANQKKAVGLALLYGYQGNRNNLSGSDDEKWLATQTLVWEFVTGCREATGSYNQTSTTVYSLHLERIDSELQAINSTLTTSEWQLKSSVNQKELYNQMNYSLSLLGNGAAILLIVIGLINFVNVMLTGVVARKNEFAIMESIGTTKKQIRKILTLEGGIYALISTLLIMTFGNAFLMLVADAVPHMANYAVFKYPVALVIGLIAAIFVICLSVPAIVYKATSDETVIERLHNFDS